MNDSKYIGRLTRDPELHHTHTGKSVLSFVLAVNRPKRKAKPGEAPSANENKQDCDFIHCVIWNGAAELISKKAKKGTQLAISGPMQSRSYEVKNEKKQVTECVVRSFEFVGKVTPSNSQAPAAAAISAMGVDIPEEDAPF